MNVLVTGGAGYLGGAVVDALQGDHQVRVYDSLLYHDLYTKDVDFVCGDVRSNDLRVHLRWAEAVVWLAALVGDAACERAPEQAEAVNHLAVARLAREFDGRIVFISTCSVYGHGEGELDESSPLAPISAYARTKLEAERELSARGAVVLRLGTLYGVGDRHGRFRVDLVVNGMTVRAVLERRIEVRGGNQWRPLTHVRDAAHAVRLAVDSAPNRPTGAFNVVGDNLTIRRVAEVVRDGVPEAALEFFPGAQDPRDYRASGVRARDVLGFTPRSTVADGVREVATLLRSGRLADPSSRRFTN